MKAERSEQAGDSPLSAWLEAHKAFVESWANMMAAAALRTPLTEVQTAKGQESAPGWDQWQQSLDSWDAGMAPIARAVAEQFYAVQEIAMNFLSFSARTWQAMAPGIETGEALESALEQQRDQAFKDWMSFPTEFSEALEDMNRLWQLYMEQWQHFGAPWASAFQSAPEFVQRAASGDSSALMGLSDLYRETYQNTLGRLVASPNLGPTRELNEKLLRGFDAWFVWQTAVLEYQSVLQEAWQAAIQRFMEQLVALAEQDEKITSVRDLTLLWTRGAEEVFTDVFRTEKYVLAQGRMLNAAMEYRIHQRAILETYLNAYDLPTRSELDEAHRRIYDLRKEVKALKKELVTLKGTLKAAVDGEGDSLRKTRQRKPRKSETENEGG